MIIVHQVFYSKGKFIIRLQLKNDANCSNWDFTSTLHILSSLTSSASFSFLKLVKCRLWLTARSNISRRQLWESKDICRLYTLSDRKILRVRGPIRLAKGQCTVGICQPLSNKSEILASIQFNSTLFQVAQGQRNTTILSEFGRCLEISNFLYKYSPKHYFRSLI